VEIIDPVLLKFNPMRFAAVVENEALTEDDAADALIATVGTNVIACALPAVTEYDADVAYEALEILPSNTLAVPAYEELTTPPNNALAVIAYDAVPDKDAVIPVALICP